jgi:tyrosine-protein kinase Etk/Wzc
MNGITDHTMENTTGKEHLSFGDILVEFASVIVTWRRFLIIFVGCITIGCIIAALVMPKWYKATTSVFPAENAELPTGIEGLGLLTKGFNAARALTSFSGSPELDRYETILKSSSVLGAVITKFDLVRVYDIHSYPGENTAKELLSNLQITIEPQGNLTITVFDKDPQRAADMANCFVSELNRVNSDLLVQNARANREFIEQRYRKNLEDIHVAEEALKNFQIQNGVIAVPEQTEATIKANAELYGMLATKEIELSVLERTMSPTHPSIEGAKIQIDEMRKKLNEMNNGVNLSQDDLKVLVPLKQAPELAVHYIRLYRNAEIQYKILQFLTPIFEQAKVDEQRQTPSVLVLDRAAPPERKARPRITVFALVGFIISSLLGLFAIFCSEAVARLRKLHPEQFDGFATALRNDWIKLRRKVRRNQGA